MNERGEVNNIKRYIFLPAVGLVLVAAALFGVHGASAQDNGESPSLVTKIAEKFGLKEADVQAVFDEEREEHHAGMQDQMDERLTQAVTEGKITDAQKQAILTKMKELHDQKQETFEEFKNLSPEERKEAMQKKHDELKSWADSQGIDMENLFGAFGKHPGGFKFRMH